MRTDFFVLGGGEAASSSTVRRLLLDGQHTQKDKAREYHGRCLPAKHCYRYWQRKCAGRAWTRREGKLARREKGSRMTC
jgi:hypothetical protein